MLRASLLALADLMDRSLRQALWLAIGLTALLLAGLGYGAHLALEAVPPFQWAWLNTIVEIAGNLGIVVASILLAAPAASLFIAFFLEDVAAAVEKKRYPADPPGRNLDLVSTLTTTLAFLLALILVNLFALPFYFVPGANLAVYLIGNGYLVGREYFELVALRHHPPGEALRLRKANRLRVFLAGAIIALALLVPILNLLAPLFGTAFMVHVYKHAEKRSSVPA